MIVEDALAALQRFKDGKLSARQLLSLFQAPTSIDLGFANVDTHRSLRTGFPEVIFGQGKTAQQIVAIARTLLKQDKHILITRIAPAQATAVRKKIRNATHHAEARCITIGNPPAKPRPGFIAVVAAGTSDLPVAEEAVVTATAMGNRVERVYDVGVAGIHRLFKKLPRLLEANVLIVVAGMEGALPSVVAGLVSRPIIAVPTSIGYGANFGGLSALLTMLNSCGSGVTVVNIDNGFGAAFAASQIQSLLTQPQP